jgi:hypothetical protein
LDDSDEPEGLVRHLPTRLLKAGAQKRTKKWSAIGNRLEAATSDEEENDDVQEVRETGNWSRQNSDMVGSRVSVWVKPVMTAENSDMLADLSSAYDYYKLFQPASFAEEVVYQSKLYAVQKDKKQAFEVMNIDTYRCSEALLIHSGYHTVPRRCMLLQPAVGGKNQKEGSGCCPVLSAFS